MAPRDIEPGRLFTEAIIDAIVECKICLLIFSSASNESRFVIRELELALDKEIIPFCIENVPLSKSMRILIGLSQRLDATTPPLQKHIDRLIETLAKKLSQSGNQEKATQSLQKKPLIFRTKEEIEKEAIEIIGSKDNIIDRLDKELEVIKRNVSENKENTERMIAEYKHELEQQKKLKEEMSLAAKKFKENAISSEDFNRMIAYQEIEQDDSSGFFTGQFKIEKKMLRIYQGDITDLAVDVIVSSDDTHLSMGGGVSQRIAEVAGEMLIREANTKTRLKMGDVAVTTAGNLHAKKVYHGIINDFNFS